MLAAQGENTGGLSYSGCSEQAIPVRLSVRQSRGSEWPIRAPIQPWAIIISQRDTWLSAVQAMSYSSEEEGSLAKVRELFPHHRAVCSSSALEIRSSKGAKGSSEEWLLEKGEGVCMQEPGISDQITTLRFSTAVLNVPCSLTQSYMQC